MANATDIDKVRRAIGDVLKTNVEQYVGDDATSLFNLRYNNINLLSLKIDGVDAAPATVYEDTGKILLTTPLPSDSNMVVEYGYAAYTAAGLGALIDQYGVAGTIVETLKELLASASRRSDYSQGQTKVNASQVYDHLKELLAMYQAGGSLAGGNSSLSIGKRQAQQTPYLAPSFDLSRDDRWDNLVA